VQQERPGDHIKAPYDGAGSPLLYSFVTAHYLVVIVGMVTIMKLRFVNDCAGRYFPLHGVDNITFDLHCLEEIGRRAKTVAHSV